MDNKGAIALAMRSDGKSAFKVFWIEALMLVTIAKDGLRVDDILEQGVRSESILDDFDKVL